MENNIACGRFVCCDASFDILDCANGKGICGRGLPVALLSFLTVVVVAIILTHHFCGL